MPTLFPDDIRSIIEALLFVSNEPLPIATLAEILDREAADVEAALIEIKADCERESRGFFLLEVAGGFSYVTRPEYAPFVEQLVKPRLNTLTQAALETLAIVAYKQPITRSEIEEIRGVKSESPLSTIVERGLIVEIGRRESPGRPILYGTTPAFLKYFGMKCINDLPRKEEDMGKSKPQPEEKKNLNSSEL